MAPQQPKQRGITALNSTGVSPEAWSAAKEQAVLGVQHCVHAGRRWVEIGGRFPTVNALLSEDFSLLVAFLLVTFSSGPSQRTL